MSHLTTITTKMTDPEFAIDAMQNLGHALQSDRSSIRGFAGRTTEVDYCFAGNGRYDIGLRKRGATYELVADWMLLGIDQTAFCKRLTQRYAYCATRHQLAEQGFEVAHEEVQSDGRIHLVLRRAVSVCHSN